MFHRISTTQHGGMKSGIAWYKTQPSRKQCVLVHCLAGRRRSQAIPRAPKCAKVVVLCVFVAAMAKLKQFDISEPDKVYYSATVSTVCDKPVCTHGTLWHQHYITTSKEYLINSSSSANLVIILCSLNWLFEWIIKERKRAPFYETPCILVQKQLLLSLKDISVTAVQVDNLCDDCLK